MTRPRPLSAEETQQLAHSLDAFFQGKKVDVVLVAMAIYVGNVAAALNIELDALLEATNVISRDEYGAHLRWKARQ